MAGAKAKTLDFTGVKDGGSNFRPRRKPEGDYYGHIAAVGDHTSKEGNEGWVFTIQVDGDARSSYPYYINFDSAQLWKPRALCIAAGLKVPSSKVKLDPNKLVGKALGIALEDDEYEGRVKSTIAAVFPLDELSDPQNSAGKASSAKAKSREADEDDEDDEDEDEEPAPKKAAKGKAKRKPEPDEDEDEEEDDEDEDDEPPARKSKKAAPAKKGKKTPVDDDDDEEDDEDDDEDDEPAPPKKSKGKAAAPAKKGKSKRKSDDDDDELDIDDL